MLRNSLSKRDERIRTAGNEDGGEESELHFVWVGSACRKGSAREDEGSKLKL